MCNPIAIEYALALIKGFVPLLKSLKRHKDKQILFYYEIKVLLMLSFILFGFSYSFLWRPWEETPPLVQVQKWREQWCTSQDQTFGLMTPPLCWCTSTRLHFGGTWHSLHTILVLMLRTHWIQDKADGQLLKTHPAYTSVWELWCTSTSHLRLHCHSVVPETEGSSQRSRGSYGIPQRCG